MPCCSTASWESNDWSHWWRSSWWHSTLWAQGNSKTNRGFSKEPWAKQAKQKWVLFYVLCMFVVMVMPQVGQPPNHHVKPLGLYTRASRCIAHDPKWGDTFVIWAKYMYSAWAEWYGQQMQTQISHSHRSWPGSVNEPSTPVGECSRARELFAVGPCCRGNVWLSDYQGI